MAVASRPSATSITAGTKRTIADRKRHAFIATGLSRLLLLGDYSPHSAGLAVGAPVVEVLVPAAFFSTQLTAMIEPS